MPIEMPRGLPFSVDTWSPNSNLKRHHFLTHAHKDHCSGITSHNSYPIYCTHLTKSIILCYYPQLDESLFVGIEVGQTLTLDDPNGSFTVTAYDANHCPGAVMFLFEGEFGNILHTGDCRLTTDCLQNLPEKYITKNEKVPRCQLDFVFLDCTFGKSLMKIPSKQSALQEVMKCIWEHPDTPKVYLTCNMLGQEEVLLRVFQTFGSKIYVDKSKHPEFYQVLELTAPQILSEDPSSRFHLFEGFPKLYEKAKKIMSEARENMQPEPLIVRPSAQWYAHEETELTAMERKILERSNIPVKDQFGVWHVCYSLHSSRQELEWALELLSPKRVVSTTPECRAMELGYVKKHCFSNQASDDRIWKVMGMTMEASPTAEVLEESSVSSVVEVNVTTNAASEDREVQLPKTLSNQESVLNLPPPSKKPPITLFGRARLGYHSCILAEETKIMCVGEKYTPSPILDSGNKSPSLSLSEESPYVPECAKNDPICLSNNQQIPLTDICITTCTEEGVQQNNAEQKILSSDGKENIAEKPKENNLEAVNFDGESGKLRRDATMSKSVSHSTFRSSTGYRDNIRKLYRSMTAPMPRPLPSLVKLMESCKRTKRK